MGKIKMLTGVLSLMMSIGLFSSCSSAEDSLLDTRQTNMSKPAMTAKEQFVSDLKVAFGNVKKGEKPHLNMEQIDYLGESARRMLKSEGMYTKDMKKLYKKNKAGVILIGTLYLGFTAYPMRKDTVNASRIDSVDVAKNDSI